VRCPFCFVADIEHGVPCPHCNTTTAIKKRQVEEERLEDVAVNDPDWKDAEVQAKILFDDISDDDQYVNDLDIDAIDKDDDDAY